MFKANAKVLAQFLFSIVFLFFLIVGSVSIGSISVTAQSITNLNPKPDPCPGDYYYADEISKCVLFSGEEFLNIDYGVDEDMPDSDSALLLGDETIAMIEKYSYLLEGYIWRHGLRLHLLDTNTKQFTTHDLFSDLSSSSVYTSYKVDNDKFLLAVSDAVTDSTPYNKTIYEVRKDGSYRLIGTFSEETHISTLGPNNTLYSIDGVLGSKLFKMELNTGNVDHILVEGENLLEDDMFVRGLVSANNFLYIGYAKEVGTQEVESEHGSHEIPIMEKGFIRYNDINQTKKVIPLVTDHWWHFSSKVNDQGGIFSSLWGPTNTNNYIHKFDGVNQSEYNFESWGKSLSSNTTADPMLPERTSVLPVFIDSASNIFTRYEVLPALEYGVIRMTESGYFKLLPPYTGYEVYLEDSNGNIYVVDSDHSTEGSKLVITKHAANNNIIDIPDNTQFMRSITSEQQNATVSIEITNNSEDVATVLVEVGDTEKQYLQVQTGETETVLRDNVYGDSIRIFSNNQIKHQITIESSTEEPTDPGDTEDPKDPGSSDGDSGQTVYRFFNKKNGSYLYTTSKSEKESVLKLTDEWTYEGEKFNIIDSETPGAVPVHRFFNKEQGGHLFTISKSERNTVLGMSKYRYEGVMYYVFEEEQDKTLPVYRFFDLKTGVHLYTISENEKREIIDTGKFRYEGVSYYVNSL